jgi:Cdc6-like AAA superfamily ATPase
MNYINPFEPNAPINPGMFVGRIPELDRLESCLLQTKAQRSMSFMITGERGIGKTSLLSYIKYVATGYIPVNGKELNFLVIDVDVEKSTTFFGLIKKIEIALRRELNKTEKGRAFFNDAWQFLKRVEAAGFKLNSDSSSEVSETFFEEFSYSLADTILRVTSAKEHKGQLDANYDGVMILIDEADNASKELELGVFVKLTLERLQKAGIKNLMFGIAGLPNLKKLLYDSHPSSLRVLEDIELLRLSNDEIKRVIALCMEEAKTLNEKTFLFSDDAEDAIIDFSEGYPHFIQQYGFCAFAKAQNTLISLQNVTDGAMCKKGALELIGDRYYRNDFYNKIQGEGYREVLRIMADYDNQWVAKSTIKVAFTGKSSTLDNALHTLKERNIILSKEGEKGVYRLQDRGFAHWIKLYTNRDNSESYDGELPL